MCTVSTSRTILLEDPRISLTNRELCHALTRSKHTVCCPYLFDKAWLTRSHTLRWCKPWMMYISRTRSHRQFADRMLIERVDLDMLYGFCPGLATRATCTKRLEPCADHDAPPPKICLLRRRFLGSCRRRSSDQHIFLARHHGERAKEYKDPVWLGQDICCCRTRVAATSTGDSWL